MNARALRRLAADHAALHNQDLPPNYFFPVEPAHSDNLTQLDILLAGPTHTPFVKGVWKLHLTIPPQYPQQPPTANFRTPIFHPNVDPQTGGVCVETLKRDWDSKLTLRDVLVTISCLLIQPNPDSALNADAGALIQEGYASFAKRAELMTSIHAVIPKPLAAAVREAQSRGQEPQEEIVEEESAAQLPEPPARRRRTIARVRAARRGDGSPTGAPGRSRQQPPASSAFVRQADDDDIFGGPPRTPHGSRRLVARMEDDDESMGEGEQENDSFQSPAKAPTTPKTLRTPRRPQGVPIPLGELIMEQEEDEEDDDDSADEMEAEYPPSPRKSPSKSPQKRKQGHFFSSSDRPEASSDAAFRAPKITPPNLTDKPLAEDSPLMMDVTFDESLPQRNASRKLFETAPKRAPKKAIENMPKKSTGFTPRVTSGTRYSTMRARKRSTSPAERELLAEQARADANSKLWMQCGEDIKRWNRGDFDGEPFTKKAARW